MSGLTTLKDRDRTAAAQPIGYYVDGSGTYWSGVVLTDGQGNLGGQVGGFAANPSSSFTRPANVTAYSSGQIVANSVTAASVVPLSFTAARVAAGSFCVRRGRIAKSGTSTTNAAFRIHLFSSLPTIATAGDGGTFASDVSGYASYLGYLDVTAMQGLADGATGQGGPGVGSEMTVVLASGQTIYGLLEARGAYTPASAETFAVELEVLQN